MKTLRQLFALRNIVPLITIVLAFTGAANLLGRLGIQSDQVILALLGVLAIDALVERLGYLSRIEDRVNALSAVTNRPMFLSRALLNADEPFEEFLTQGHDVLFVGVTHLAVVGPTHGLLRMLMQQGATLRFLILDPDSDLLGVVAGFHGVSPDSIRNEISATLDRLLDISNNSGKGSLQVRFLRCVPSASVTVRDGYHRSGEVRCELYLYRADVAARPAFRLTFSDGAVYRRYVDAMEKLWGDSEPYQKAT